MIQTNLSVCQHSSYEARYAFSLEDIWVDLYCFVLYQKCAMCQRDPGSPATTHGFSSHNKLKYVSHQRWLMPLSGSADFVGQR